jgi:hypothetical protein
VWTVGVLKTRSGRAYALAGVAVAAAGVVLCLGSTVGFTYSRGQRVGFVRKLSERGWACKTYEGTLAMTAEPVGGAARLWQFSVRDKTVVDQIDALSGQSVVLRYEQRKGVAAPCVGDTEYFVVGVRRID